MITLSSNIQSERRDSIVVCPDLQIAIRANGEEVTSMVDIAGNLYPAGIPEATVAVTPALAAVTADALPDGWYAWTYVYAAKNRYPYVDAGKAMQGSIAPRGNPAPFGAVFHMTGGPRKASLTIPGSERLDIDQIIVFRTVTWGTQAEAKLAANAGQFFSIAILDNTLPDQVYVDDHFEPTGNEQVEYDNNFAPTMQYLAYESPYLWGIGNDAMIKRVTWASDTILLDDEGKWFAGRDGQLVTVTGMTTGGIDGRGTFIFKAGNASGLNVNNSAILTIDGTTPEVLSPASGSGYIKIQGPATTLYRSKPRNPLAWGETIFVGTARFSQLFARKIGGGRATAIAIVPGGEYLKIDVKDPSRCFTFSLRSAGTPNFESSRREISDMSMSHHFSQFVATDARKQKVLWGWDTDNHAILECDGNTQRIISDEVFVTMKQCQTNTRRAQYSQGLCNEELELNIMFLPWGESINATDLAVFQHYSSGKWGTALVGDLLSICTFRDPLTNLLRQVAGHDLGRLCEHQLGTVPFNQFTFVKDAASFPTTRSIGVVYGGSNLRQWTGAWVCWYSNKDPLTKYGRIATIINDDVTGETVFGFDKIISFGDGSIRSYDLTLATLEYDDISDVKFVMGQIPTFMEKILELGTPTQLKVLEAVSLTGQLGRPLGFDPEDIGVGALYLFTPNFVEVDRYPNAGVGSYVDTVVENQGNYVYKNVSIPQHGRVSLRIFFNLTSGLLLRMLNLDIR